MRVGLIGSGLIGEKRLKSLFSLGADVVGAFDINTPRNLELTKKYKIRKFDNSQSLIDMVGRGGLIIVATRHDSLVSESKKAVSSGCHVLVEKPGARSSKELKELLSLAQMNRVHVRVGFNHRFHPSIAMLKSVSDSNEFGDVQLIRARYGHGGRIGYEHEWRSKKELSGGGELLDQGSHLLDLVQFLFGDYKIEFASLANLYWKTDVEDNAFLCGKTLGGAKIWLHASWTEWKNLFSFEVFFKTAKVEISGLGGSYGPESITIHHMESGLGPPISKTTQFPSGDDSWALEIADCMSAINGLNDSGADIHSTLVLLNHLDEIYAQ